MGTDYFIWTAEKQYQINAGIYQLLQKIASYYRLTDEMQKREALYKKAIGYRLETDWAYYKLINMY